MDRVDHDMPELDEVAAVWTGELRERVSTELDKLEETLEAGLYSIGTGLEEEVLVRERQGEPLQKEIRALETRLTAEGDARSFHVQRLDQKLDDGGGFKLHVGGA